jgi:hypothetical protein
MSDPVQLYRDVQRIVAVGRVARLASPSYIRATARGEFGFLRDWGDLSIEQLEHLEAVITRRRAAEADRVRAEAAQLKLFFQ